jgi:RNA polymerase-binding transcription factor DksA
MARAGASKSLDKPAPRARGNSDGSPAAPKAVAKKAVAKKAAEPVAKKAKAPAPAPAKKAAKAVKAVKAGKAASAAKVSRPSPPATPAKKAPVKAVKAVKATKTVKAVKATKVVKAAPARAATKSQSPTVARNTRPKKTVEVPQVPEAKGKRGGAATKAPPTAAPAVTESADFSPKTMEKLRRLLEEERETYVRQARDLAAEAEALASEREPGDTQFDEESGEGDTLNVERERDLALSASATQAVEEIDRALRRMDIGSFGICERCGKKITVARLEALPFAALCIECKSREERRR